MAEQSTSQSKKIRVNAASLVDLKAALFRKQQEVKHGGSTSKPVARATRLQKVTERTASIWRKPPKKLTTIDHSKTSDRRPKISSLEEDMDLARSKAALEAKAALYDRLMKGGEDLSSSEDEDDDKPRMMVDFQRKIYEQVSRAKEKQVNSRSDKVSTSPLPPNTVDDDNKPPADSDEEWVDYTDSLGRSRRCLKKDLPQMLEIDQQMESEKKATRSGSSSPDLLSEDMRRERERQKWEEEAYRETMSEDYQREEEETDEYGAWRNSEEMAPLHYQSVRQKEIRNLGVGYYAFDTDEEKREEQMKMLSKLRDDTKDQRVKREKIKEKRKALLEAKLAKIRQRKLKDKGGDATNDVNEGSKDLALSSGIADFHFEKANNDASDRKKDNAPKSLEEMIKSQVAEAREKAEAEDRKKHKRPWDRGKAIDPIRKRKKELEEERLSEFAPPSSYKKAAYPPVITNPTPPPPPPLYPPPPSVPSTTDPSTVQETPSCAVQGSTVSNSGGLPYQAAYNPQAYGYYPYQVPYYTYPANYSNNAVYSPAEASQPPSTSHSLPSDNQPSSSLVNEFAQGQN